MFMKKWTLRGGSCNDMLTPLLPVRGSTVNPLFKRSQLYPIEPCL